MGYRKLSDSPRHHVQAEGAIENFMKSCQPAWMKSRAKWRSMFADEARIGQKNKITRRWTKRGTRPRTASTYIFGAICPKQGKGPGLVLPARSTEAMNLHLVGIANAVVVDQAG